MAIVFPPVVIAIVGANAALWADSVAHGWTALAIGLLLGAVPALVATVVYARRGKLFLTDEAAIERNRSAISNLSIPLGWALCIVGFVALRWAPDALKIAVLGLVCGVLLGFYPGLLANFLRLRRERFPSEIARHG